jgi:hypothetical protein
MKPRRRTLSGRDQAATPFGGTLLRLCDNTGALGAALVDQEGETVDYAGSLDPYEIRVAAAEWRLVLRYITASMIPTWSDTHELIIRSRRRSYAVRLLPEGYAIVLQLFARCFSVSHRALGEAVRDLCTEAGFELPHEIADREKWTRVEVNTVPEDPRRPAAIWAGSVWLRVEVLGRYNATALERGEVGYRARLANGAEVNLVREQLGRWYAEDLPEH